MIGLVAATKTRLRREWALHEGERAEKDRNQLRWSPFWPTVLSVTPVFVSLVCACSQAPPPASSEPIERLPTAEEAAIWTVDAQRARELAVALMEAEPDRFTRVTVNAIVRHGTPIWRVSATSIIAGGWDVEIDPRNGQLISARRRTGR